MKSYSFAILAVLVIGTSLNAMPAQAKWECECRGGGDGGGSEGETRQEAVKNCGGKVASCHEIIEKLDSDDPVCRKHPDLKECQ